VEWGIEFALVKLQSSLTRSALLVIGWSLLLGAPGGALAAQGKGDALRELKAAARARDAQGFLDAARTVLQGAGARELREVVEAYGDLVSAEKGFDAEEFFSVHSEAARLAGRSVKGLAAELLKLLKTARAWGARLLALDAAVVASDSEPLQAPLVAIEDKDARVLRRALAYLRNAEPRIEGFAQKLAIVDAVLERYLKVDADKSLKGGEWERARMAFRETLAKYVKVSVPSAADFKNYVDVRRADPELFQPREHAAGGLTRLTLFGAEVSGKNIVFIIDVSGSMMATDPVKLPEKSSSGGTVVKGSEEEKKRLEEERKAQAERIESRRRITRAKQELSKVIGALPDDVRFNIISYSSDVSPWKTKSVAAGAGSRKEAREFIDRLKAEGITVTDMALDSAFEDIDIDTVYLITDGAPTHVGSQGPGRPPDADEIIAAIHARMKAVNFLRGVRIFTLGFPEADEEFLKQLAADHSGQYAPIE
jgi:hypothetical protein